MSGMQRFERRVEELVNRVFARTFKAEVQPVEIAAALRREADDKLQVLSRERSMIPNCFVVELGRRDHERLAPWSEPLTAELATLVQEHADQQGYAPAGPLRVELTQVDGLDTGVFRVRSRVDAHAEPSVRPRASRPGAVPPGPVPPGPVPPSADRPGVPPRPTAPRVDRLAEPPAAPGGGGLPDPAQASRPSGGLDATTVLRAPSAPRRMTWLEIDGSRYSLDTPVTVLGRGSDADVRLSDPGVSRRHVQVQTMGDRVRVVDLGSTNGTLVGGRRVVSADLANGESFVLGRTTVTVRSGTVRSTDNGDHDVVPGLR